MKITPKFIIKNALFIICCPILSLLLASIFISIIYTIFGKNNFVMGSYIANLGLGITTAGYIALYTKIKINKLKAFFLLITPSLTFSLLGALVPYYSFLTALTFAGPWLTWSALKYWKSNNNA